MMQREKVIEEALAHLIGEWNADYNNLLDGLDVTPDEEMNIAISLLTVLAVGMTGELLIGTAIDHKQRALYLLAQAINAIGRSPTINWSDT